MYQMTDEKKYLNSLRKMLFLKENGRYDSELKTTLKKYGAEEKLPSFSSYIAIKAEYKKRLREKELKRTAPFVANTPLRFGDSGSGIIILNAILYDLIKFYRLSGLYSPLGCVYSKRTAEAVHRMHEIFLMKPKDYCDADFLYRLLLEHKSIYLRKEERNPEKLINQRTK